MKLIFHYISRKNRWIIFLSLLLMVGTVALEMKIPEYTKQITEAVSDGSVTMELVKDFGWRIFRLGVLGTLISVVSGLGFMYFNASYGRDLRGAIFKQVNRLENESVNRLTVGSLITRANNDVGVAQLTIMTIFGSGVLAPISAVWALLKIRSTNKGWITSALVCTVSLCVILIVLTVWVYPKLRKLRTIEDNLNTTIRQGMEGIRVIRAFRADGFQNRRTDGVNKTFARSSFVIACITNMFNPLVSLCRNALSVSIYWIGALTMMKVSASGRAVVMGNMSAFTQYSLQIISAFTSLVAIFVLMPEAMISIRRIEELFKQPRKITYPEKETVHASSGGSIELKNVSFTYDGAISPCLKNLSLSISAGEKIAVTGSTGCGKTTFLYLLRRLLAGQEGEIILSGSNIKDYTEEQLSRMISVVPQRDILFSGDIKFNICYGLDYDENRFRQALLAAGVDFLGEESEAFKVSQNGTNLSGGQRQRLCLARALYRKADVYLFDDAFSALDTLTERQVQENLNTLYKDDTVIMAAQRLSTLRAADRIVVLDAGQILDTGTHEELLERCPFYAQLVASQEEREVLA